MSKVLKVVAFVGSIAAAAVTLGASLGISVAVLSAISLGAGLGASLLSPRPKAPANSSENIDRLRATIDPRTPRKTVVGITALANDIRDEEFTGDQEYLHRFIVVASHKANAIKEIWFDDKIAWTLAGGVQGEFAGYLTVAPILEGSAANAINISSRMGSTRRYTGMAYVHLRYKLTGNSKKADSPFASSITTRITIRGEGAALPDPRDPAHDMADQSTWTWDADAARNPALQLLFYLLGYRIQNPVTSEWLLAVGKGISPARIDLDSFAVAANICDEMVATQAGGTEPRYRTDGVWSEGDNPTTVLDMLKASMNADLDDVNGKLRLTVFHNDLAVPDAEFTDDDILDGFEWEESPPLDQTSNIVRGVFTDPSNESLYQPVDYPQVEESSPDGIERIDTFNLPMVQSADQAQRLAGLRLARQTHGAGTFRGEFQATAWAVQKNSVVSLTFAARGWVNKLFRVAEMDIRVDGVVPLVLREESAAIYDAPALSQPVDPIASTPFDFTKSAVYQTLSAAEQNLIATSSQAGLTVSATDTAITINNHSRKYADRTVSITGETLTTEDDGSTALAPSTQYYLYYDDGARAGGAVGLKATQDFFAAQNDADNPDRHYAGYIMTDTTGGGGSSGGGSLPPGSGGVNPY